MLVKIQGTSQEVRQIPGDPSGTWYTGLKIEGAWFNIEGDHRDLYQKTVDLELDGKFAKFSKPQTPPAPAQTPPPPKPTSINGHTPRWPSRDSAVAAYIFYAVEIEQYIKEPYAIVRAANCLMTLESHGEINPVHEVIQ